GESAAHGLRYWDLAVDDRLLRELLMEGPAETSRADLAPVLVHNWPNGMSNDVLVLLGERPAELTTGRVPVFVCSVCGDLDCGATTVAVERTADTVAWRNFGWETTFTLEDDDGEYVPIAGGPFVFARDQYERELRRFVDTFDKVRAAGSPTEEATPPDDRRGRRRWWPRR
ncbi:hypothetical protein ACFQL5_19350, partial [Aquipuribacter hungaricus]